MGLADLFRPKHKHSDAQVRADAVRRMTLEDSADLLASIARGDDDATVRGLAIDKLDDPDLLIEIAAAESDGSLKRRAEQRAAELWTFDAVHATRASSGKAALAGLERIDDQRAIAEVVNRAELPEVRRFALDKLTDARALAELARSASATDLRTTAIARIDDAEVLRSIAVDETRKPVALAALDRIDEQDHLEVIATKAKLKAVRNRARKKRDELAPASTEISEERLRHAERVQLVRVVEKLAKAHEYEASLPKVQEAERDWERVGPGADASLSARFERAVAKYHKRREKYGAKVVAKPAPAPAPAPEAETPEVQAEAVEAVQTPAPEADAEATRKAREAERAAAKAATRLENLQRLEDLCVELEGAFAGNDFRAAERKLKGARKRAKKLEPLPADERGEKMTARFEEARQKLYVKVQELREADDWKRWANVPQREKLIAHATELLADTEAKGLAKKLKRLQAEWKEIGPVPQKKGQELWDTFKATCDQIYERVKEERKRSSAEQAENLEKKRALCEQVEAISDSTEWQQTAEEIKRLQAEWKEIGPVPRKHSDAIWKRFRAACDHFFERRKPHIEEQMAERNRNLAAKEALCEEAEKLAESDDWEETPHLIKKLQHKWRDIGHVPRKDVNAVSKRFRAACDRFFERRDQKRADERAARERELEELRQRIDELIAGGDASSEEVVAKTLEVRAAALELSGEARSTRELLDRINEMCAKVVGERPEAFGGTELDPEVNARRKRKLCERVEELIPSNGAGVSVDDDAGTVAERLKAAMAQNAFGGPQASTDGRSVKEVVADLRTSWRRLGPVPGDEGARLEQRFSDACRQALHAAGEPVDETPPAPQARSAPETAPAPEAPAVETPSAPEPPPAPEPEVLPAPTPEPVASAAAESPKPAEPAITPSPGITEDELDAGWD